MTRIIVVTGSRHYTGRDIVYDRLNLHVPTDSRRLYVVHGDAKGVDATAKQWCRDRGVQPVACEALWTAYDNAAGARRNGEMLDFVLLAARRPGVEIAFEAFPGPQSRGTHDMIAKIRREGYDVYITQVPE